MNTRVQILALCIIAMISTWAHASVQARFEETAPKLDNPCAYHFQSTPDGSELANSEEALKATSECIALSSTSLAMRAGMLRIRSLAYEQLKDFKRAIVDYENALQLVPARTAWDIITLASYYREAGQPEHALLLLKQMLSDHLGTSGKGSAPGMPSYYNLGITLIALQEWPEAAEAISEGLTYQTTYSWAYLYRALAYDHMNNAELARADIYKVRSLINAEKEDVREKFLQRLKTLQLSELLIKYSE
jgi:tetratricopeptide (TPR) repeat protein